MRSEVAIDRGACQSVAFAERGVHPTEPLQTDSGKKDVVGRREVGRVHANEAGCPLYLAEPDRPKCREERGDVGLRQKMMSKFELVRVVVTQASVGIGRYKPG